MSVTINASEQALSGGVVVNFQLELTSERITAKELVRSRVFQKVKDHNANELQREGSKSDELVPRNESELTLNRRPEGKNRLADFETEFDRAVEAFRKKQILVLVDGKQLVNLDDEVQVDATSEISFLRLTLLAGG